MFVIELTYTAPLDEIDQAMRAHMAFLNAQYAAGTFVLSGRKVPREGGVILAVGESKAAIEELMRTDPFCSRGLAEFRVIEFNTSQRAADVPARIK
ncbi:MAG TPA: YciI family protein [Polyangiaceae bacterium]|nr:YciI family protein [Polyangiaceae bacterium]